MYVGIDMSRALRWERLLNRFPAQREKIFTEEEIAHCERRGRQRTASYAALWAVREAAGKALGIGILGAGWQAASVTWSDAGAPRLMLHGIFAERAKALGITEWAVSITHEAGLSAAVVVMQGGNDDTGDSRRIKTD